MVVPLPFTDNLKGKRFPWGVFFILSACVALFALARYFDSAAAKWLDHYGALRPSVFLETWRDVFRDPGMLFSAPSEFFVLGVLPAFGHMFLHAHEIHLLGNMLFLWVFGWGLESRLGTLRFLFFYFLCGLIAMSVHLALDPVRGVPMVGSSGAIAGILGGYLLAFPRARIRVVLWIFFLFAADVPAFAFLLVWFLFQLLNAQHTLLALEGWTGIAYFAHVGGFLAGMLLIGPFLWKKKQGVHIDSKQKKGR